MPFFGQQSLVCTTKTSLSEKDGNQKHKTEGREGGRANQDSLTVRYEGNQLLGKVIRLGSLQAT